MLNSDDKAADWESFHSQGGCRLGGVPDCDRLPSYSVESVTLSEGSTLMEINL